MPYQELIRQSEFDKSGHGWQIRIAIDPSVLIENDADNQIEIIKNILNDTLGEQAVDVKLWTIPQEKGLYDDDYDGTINTRGKDRDERGKEVCIYVNNSDHALSVKE